GNNFDLALVPRRDHDYYGAKLLAFLSGARWRVGYEPSGPHEAVLTEGGGPLLTHVVRDATTRHETESVLKFLCSLGGSVETSALEVRVTADDQAAVDAMLDARGIKGPIVALGIGAGARRRRWPSARFEQLARFVRERLRATVVIVGSERDRADGKRLVGAVGCNTHNLAGSLSLRQSAALLGRCRLFLGNDSGPMHLAASQ